MKNKIHKANCLTGYVMGISHIFYLPKQSKVFFLELLTQTNSVTQGGDDNFNDENEIKGTNQDNHNREIKNKMDETCSWKISRLILSLSSPCNQEVKAFSKEIMQFPKLGILLNFTNFKDAILHKNTEDPSTVFQLTKKSTIKVVKDDVLKDTFENFIINNDSLKNNNTTLVSYKGVITSVKDSNSGIYKIDKKIFLVTSSLCIVSNVPKLQLGQEITLYDIHYVNMGKQKYLLMCGRSFVVIHDSVQAVHPSSYDTDTYKLDPFIRLVQDLHPDAKDLLTLLHNRIAAYASFSDHTIRKNILESCVRNTGGMLARSLTKEFLDHDRNCCLLRDEENCVRPFWTVSQLLDHVQAEVAGFEPMKLGWDGKLEEFILEKEDEVGFLCGILDVNNAGRLILKDSSHEIVVLTTTIELSRMIAQLKGRLMVIESVELGIEREGLGEVLPYLVAHRCEPLAGGNIEEARADETIVDCTENVTVIAKSEIMKSSKSKDSLYYLIYYCQEIDKSWAILKLNDLHLYHLVSNGTNITITGGKQALDLPFKASTNSIVELENCFELTSDSSATISEVRESRAPFHCYRLANISAIPKNELVNIVGVVTARTNAEFPSTTKSAKPHNSTFGLASSSLHVQLRLDETEVRGDKTELHSVYLNNWSDRLNPLGVIPGNTVQFNSVKRVISKKGHSYFQSTLLTHIQLVSTPLTTSSNLSSTLASSLDTSSSRQANQLPSFSHLDMIHPHDLKVVDVLVCLYKVVRLTVEVECVNCGSEVKEGACSYVGCQAKPNIAVTVKGVFEVEDGIGKAVLIVTGENGLKTFLNLDSCGWDEIVSEAKQSGGLSYFWKEGQGKSCVLEKSAKRCCGVVEYFGARVRPFYSSGEDVLKLFSLAAWKPTASQMNQLFGAETE